jgi:hypothetical protein
MGEETFRQNLDSAVGASALFGHWKLIIGHSIRILHESFVNNPGQCPELKIR